MNHKPYFGLAIFALAGCTLMQEPGAGPDQQMDLARQARDNLRVCAVTYARSHGAQRLTASELAQAAVASCQQHSAAAERYAINAAEQRSRRTPGAIDVFAFGRQIRESAEEGARGAVLQAIAEAPDRGAPRVTGAQPL